MEIIIRKLPAKQGWAWFKESLTLLRMRFWTWLGLSLITLLIPLIIFGVTQALTHPIELHQSDGYDTIPTFLSAFILVISNFSWLFFTAIYVLFCRRLSQKQDDFAGQKNKNLLTVWRHFPALIKLALLLSAWSILTIFVSTKIALFFDWNIPNTDDFEMIISTAKFLPFFALTFLLYIPYILAIWLVLPLTLLRETSIISSLKISLLACCKNINAIVVWHLTLMLSMICAFVLSVVILLFISGPIQSFVSSLESTIAQLGGILLVLSPLMPLILSVLVTLTLLIIPVYLTYRDVLGVTIQEDTNETKK